MRYHEPMTHGGTLKTVESLQEEAAPVLPVIYRDEALLVVNKPSGLVVHRGWARDRVVVMGLARDLVGRKVYPVHRLDRGTSGVLLFTLDPAVVKPLQEQMGEGRWRKRYLALVRGIAPDGGVIDHPVPGSPKGPRVPAKTEFRRLGTFERYSLVEARPHTGRMHQIRRHLKHLSHPLIGDVRYGKGEHNRLFRARFNLHRLALHALEMELEHPLTGQALSFFAPVPPDLGDPFMAMGLGPDLYSAES